MRTKKILQAINFKINGFTIGFWVKWITLIIIGIVVDAIVFAMLLTLQIVLTGIDMFNATREVLQDAWHRIKTNWKESRSVSTIMKGMRYAIRNRIHKNKSEEALRRALEFDPHSF